MSCNLFAASKRRGIKPILDKPIDTLQNGTKTVTHVVRKGETLSKIADKYKNITYQDIAKANGLNDPNNIYIGQRLKIPKQKPIPKTPTSNPHIKPVSDDTSTGRNKGSGCGKLAGYFYTRDGKYLGHYKNKDVVYISKSKLSEDRFTNPILLKGVTHKEFQIISQIIKHEAVTSEKKEYLWIGHTANNAAKRSKKTLYSKLMTNYSSVPKSEKKPLLDKNNSNNANAARASTISVFIGDKDPTNGALFWDGTDFLAWGLHSPNGTPQNKFEEYKQIIINKEIYNDFLSKQLSKYTKGKVRYYGKYYHIPDTVFTDKHNWISNRFSYITGYKRTYKLIATGCAGRSIFWKIEK